MNGDVEERGEIIIDSGAAGNVMPKDWLMGVEAQEDRDQARFVGANGKPLGNYGVKKVMFKPQCKPTVFSGLA